MGTQKSTKYEKSLSAKIYKEEKKELRRGRRPLVGQHKFSINKDNVAILSMRKAFKGAD